MPRGTLETGSVRLVPDDTLDVDDPLQTGDAGYFALTTLVEYAHNGDLIRDLEGHTR